MCLLLPCEMIGADDGAGSAVCKLKDHTWVAPPPAGGDCEYSGDDCNQKIDFKMSGESGPPCRRRT